VSRGDFDGTVDAFRQALGAFLHGDPEPVMEFFSRRDDVTLANPLGPPHRGGEEVETAIRQAASNFQRGSVRFEEISRFATPDLGYVVYLERAQVQLNGSGENLASSLRVTMIFRREDDTWWVAHRHADPITSTRPISTIIDT
jgi:ketosteroid isomerase-like protein